MAGKSTTDLGVNECVTCAQQQMCNSVCILGSIYFVGAWRQTFPWSQKLILVSCLPNIIPGIFVLTSSTCALNLRQFWIGTVLFFFFFYHTLHPAAGTWCSLWTSWHTPYLINSIELSITGSEKLTENSVSENSVDALIKLSVDNENEWSCYREKKSALLVVISPMFRCTPFLSLFIFFSLFLIFT